MIAEPRVILGILILILLTGVTLTYELTVGRTRYGKIRRMKLEELAEFLANHSGCAFCVYGHDECSPAVGCIEGIKRWLMQRNEAE